jgi:parallel beta-helix repeat protein
MHAVAVAHPGTEIDVATGSYPGPVRLTKRLTIRGFHLPTINALGYGRGILIRGARAAGSVVRGFIVKNATYEGILALRTKWVKIADNVVRHNDRGFSAPQLTGECKWNGEPPGTGVVNGVADLRAGGCGEAIHLASSSYSRVLGNQVTGNTGGIYLTDESGPAAHNLIVGNRVVRNVWDCGVTLASHSRRAVTAAGRPRPQAGGVYDNTISGNVAERNGVRLAGAGILVAAAFPGGAAYGNRIIGNIVSGNGLPGVTLHSHNWHQDLNGNVIHDNVIGHNAVSGPGDYDAGIHRTAGILVWSAKTRITRIHVSGNRISRNYFGIWTQHTPRLRRGANHYRHVRVPLSQH